MLLKSLGLILIISLAYSIALEKNKKREFDDESLEKFRSLLSDPLDEEFDEASEDDEESHVNTWVVRIDPQDTDVADSIAQKYGFQNGGRVGSFDGVYKFYHPSNDHHSHHDASGGPKHHAEEGKVPKSPVRIKRDHLEHASLLRSHPQVRWVRRERVLLRDKRTGVKGQSEIILNDPLLPEQWYVRNTGQTTGPAGFDSKVYEVWEKGYTGKGVVLSVLDDGMDHTHPELKDNYDPKASTDLNGRDSDPFPNDSDPYNAHGTKCSGTIAAKANNNLCGTGIAYDSNIGAIRMLDGKATDSLEADAFSFNPHHIDIYSCSWGPKDNGKTFGRPGKYGRLALEASATLGRNGYGSIFVWATGNGGMAGDDCNADGYVNSIYTISIGSVNEHGVSTYYGEKCASTMAVTYCSGLHKYGFTDNRANVITTYLHHHCTKHFVGTSSAAPLAAAIFALALQSNPKLTWRDMQHLVFETAQLTSPLDRGWKTNGVGRRYNEKFGFGVLNALKLVEKALKWKTVGKQHVCHFPVRIKNRDIPSEGVLKIKIKTDGCQSCLQKDKDANGTCKNSVKRLEHVVVTVTLKYRYRGDLSIELYSPNNTLSNLLHRRSKDDSKNGLKNWSFMTVYNWGENPRGTWVLKFIDKKKRKTAQKSDKKYQRDMEEVYMEMLDRKKRKAELEARKKSVRGNDEEDERSSDDVPKYAYHVPDAEVYKRAFDEIQGRYPEASDEVDEEERYVKERKRRSLDEFSLEESPVAGVVQSISLTLYGTA